MKKIFTLILAFATVSTLFACKNNAKVSEDSNNQYETVADVMNLEENIGKRKMAVVYFSATGNTKTVAEKIGEAFDIDIIAIEPEEPYDNTDLVKDAEDVRPYKEYLYDIFETGETMVEETYETVYGSTEIKKEVESEKVEPAKALPKIKKINVDKYDIIFLGYPIWYNDAPRVIYTFIKDLKNKTIIPFCTSDESPISWSEQKMVDFTDETLKFMSGKRFNVDVTTDEIKEWLKLMSADLQ